MNDITFYQRFEADILAGRKTITIPPEAVADALGLPLAGVIRDDPRVPQLAAQGASVGSRPAARLRRDAMRLFEEVRR